MLVKLTPNLKEIERRHSIAKEHDIEYIPQCDSRFTMYGTGIYQCNFEFNFSYEEFLEFESKDGKLFEVRFDVFSPTYHKSQYGVADSVDQLKEYFKEEIENPDRKFIITMTPVWQDKSNAGKGGGWRWHKWGDYIGNLNPKCEYLDDEDFGDGFQYVICFHLIEII
jgi:hypothetical protein